MLIYYRKLLLARINIDQKIPAKSRERPISHFIAWSSEIQVRFPLLDCFLNERKKLSPPAECPEVYKLACLLLNISSILPLFFSFSFRKESILNFDTYRSKGCLTKANFSSPCVFEKLSTLNPDCFCF